MTPEERKEKQKLKMRKYRAANPEYTKRNSELKARQSQRRKYWLAKYKIAKGCSECGYNHHHAALDFDHLEKSDKSFHIAQSINGRRLQNLFLEIRKCRILCANCHRLHTYTQAQKVRIYH